MFFQNVFPDEFRGNMVLGDRQYSLTFPIPANGNTWDYMLAWANEPYDLSASGILSIHYAFDVNFVNYSTLNIDVAGTTPAATKAIEVATKLNADPTFSELWVATALNQTSPKSSLSIPAQPPMTVIITRNQARAKQSIRTYIGNTGAELSLHFNKKAPVAEIPGYFVRHTIANRFAYSDSVGMLTQLSHIITGVSVNNPTVITAPSHGLTTGNTVYVYGTNSTPALNSSYTATVVDANTFTIPVNVTGIGTYGYLLSLTEYNLVVAAGLDPSAMKADWQLLRGRGSAIFNFQKITVDGTDRISQIIEYPTGALAGDISRKINYVYSGANTNPSQITEIPYTLTSGDLVTPP